MKRRRKKTDLNLNDLNELNLDLLRKFMTGEGKQARITSRFFNNLPARYQREITRTIKRARQLNLL